MLHYNFPPYSTGETKPLRGPGRREIGHGALAERALLRMIPDEDKFPYTIRVVSEILESNGSSSMASVCGGTLSLMDAGVPIKSPVAGIAMGLISDGSLTDPKTRTAILSDILGDEDHLGDMDFKVCGTEKGVTAIQMDIKIAGLSRDVLAQALEQAREGRLFILDKMLETLGRAAHRPLEVGAAHHARSRSSPTRSASSSAPAARPSRASSTRPASPSTSRTTARSTSLRADSDAVKKALDIIKGLTTEPEVGAVYKGTVTRVADFGAFIEILPGTDGLLHVSEMAHHRVDKVTDVMKEGDTVEVKVISVDRDGKIRLTRRELLPLPGGRGRRAREAANPAGSRSRWPATPQRRRA